MSNSFVMQISDSQFVEGFYIYSREAVPNGFHRMLTVLHGGGASGCTISGLSAFTEYEFFLVPFYKTVDGRPSNSRRCRTLQDGKFELCCAVRCKVVSESALFL